jgi:hypothetical protein
MTGEFDLARELAAAPLPPLEDAGTLAAIAAVTEALEQLRKARDSLEQLRYDLIHKRCSTTERDG